MISLESFDARRVNRAARQHDARTPAPWWSPHSAGAKASVQIIADCRYVGQGHEIRVSVPVRKLSDADGAN